MTSIVAERYAEALYRMAVQQEDVENQLLVARAFVSLLAKRHLLPKFDAIIDAFQRCVQEEEDQRRLHITVARLPSGEAKQMMASRDLRLARALVQVDSGIIGGMIIQDKSTIVDGSIKRQCLELKRRLCQ